MDLRCLLLIFALIYLVTLTLAAPVDQHPKIPGASENEIEENVNEVIDDKKVEAEMDDLVRYRLAFDQSIGLFPLPQGLEYGRYLQEVVKVLDQDPEFSKKLENITHDQIIVSLTVLQPGRIIVPL